MATQGQVKKIYRLETIGYDGLHKQFSTLSDDLLKIKKLIIELQGKKLGLSGDDLTKVNQQIIAAVESEAKLKTQIDATNESAKTSINTYFELNKAYQAAKKNAQDLAVSHGIESKEALEAAAAAEVYKQKLIEINNLVKQGGKPLAPVIPLTPNAPVAAPIESVTNLGGVNSADLEKTGVVITDLEAKEAALANEAVAMGQAHLEAAQDIKASGAEISAITTKYEQYTGSIRQNIIAQIENNNQLAANRAAQKEIQTTINAQGFASETQVQKLSALKEEEQLLIESNKALTVTIRNQTKEFLAAEGSIDEMQAQLNQLQQTYEQLSATEKASPFGKELKAEIDVLEPKVKSLEAELGKFSRNVGNYPTLFGGAFKVLEREIDAVQGKLVSGNFGGQELANLTAQEQVLTNATKILGQQFASTAAQQAAFKEQGRLLAQTFGTDSAVFKNFSAQVAIANTELKKTDQALSATGKTGTSVFQKLYGGLRQIANFIPGIGISGIVLLLLTPLESLATSLFDVGKKSKDAAFELLSFKEQVKLTNSVLDEAKDSYVKAFTEVNILKKEIQAAKDGFISKEEALKHYNETIGKTTGQVKSLDEAEQALTKNAEAYIQFTLLKAAANVALGKAADNAFKIQENINEGISRADISVDDQQRAVAATIKLQQEAEEAVKSGNLKRAKELQDQINKLALQAVNPEFTAQKKFEKIADDLFKKAKEISDQFKFDFFEGKGTKNNPFADQLKLIDAIRAQEIAIENKRVNQIQKLRQLTFDEEQQHLKNLEQINVTALDKKVSLYNKREGQLLLTKKKLTAEEKKDRAEFSEQITAIELDTSRKINDIEKKRFDQQVKNIQSQFDTNISQINIVKQKVIEDVNATATEKANAQLTADEKELEERKKFFISILFLNEQYNTEALRKAKEAIEKQNSEIIKDRKQVTEATIKDIQENGQKEIQATQIRYGLIRNEILTNDKITSKKREEQLKNLAAAEERTILAIELKTLQAQFEITKNLFALGLITEEAFLDAQQKFVDKANELQKGILSATTSTVDKVKKSVGGLADAVSNGLKNLFNIDEATAEGQQLAGAVGKIVAESFDLAQQAMNDYFDAEQERIQKSLELNLQRLDMEEEQVKARATSTAEIASIEKEYAAKKRIEEQKAHEQLKKSKRSEAKIAFAVELANIWAAAMQYPFPADLIIGGVLSGLAAARLSLRLNQIERETFEKGGVVEKKKSYFSRATNTVKNFFVGGKVAPTRTGGEIIGPSHKEGGVPFNYEAQGKELMIINKISAQDSRIRTITGTNRQIASKINELGGGVSFSSGAKMTKHFEVGGYLGTNLQPPVFTPSSSATINQQANVSDDRFDELITAVKDHQKATDDRIDRMQVVVVSKEITSKQKKDQQYSQVGTL